MTDTPSKVMYATLKEFAKLSNKDAARMLMKADYRYGDRTLFERMEDRSFLSREVVGAQLGAWPRGSFIAFPQSAQNVTSRIIRAQGDDSIAVATEYMSTTAAQAMVEALAQHGQSKNAYMNMVSRIISREGFQPLDRLVMLVMLFIAAGCTGSVVMAVEEVDSFSQDMLNSGFHTTLATIGSAYKESSSSSDDDACEVLGLARIVNGRLRPKIYQLSTDPEGTVIGLFPSTQSYIDDVDDPVSKRHLRIWRDEQGRWLAEGMDSTNGTKLISGEDGSVTVIEPPRRKREGWQSQPVQILPSDILCLAETSEFIVLSCTS